MSRVGDQGCTLHRGFEFPVGTSVPCHTDWYLMNNTKIFWFSMSLRESTGENMILFSNISKCAAH